MTDQMENDSVELNNSETNPQEEVKNEEVISGVLVIRNFDEQGNLVPKIALNGDVKITEIQTLLKVAIKNFEANLGI